MASRDYAYLMDDELTEYGHRQPRKTQGMPKKSFLLKAVVVLIAVLVGVLAYI